MNTKIAIEFLENNIKCVTFPLTPDKVNKIIDQIITLLKRGEKYEQMWNKFYNDWGEYPIELHDIAEFMDNIKQKYFPK